MLQAADLEVTFQAPRRRILGARPHPLVAVRRVSLAIRRGETLGLVGESGCGKSTLGRALLQLVRPSAGSVMLDGVDLCRLSDAGLRPYRRRLQMVFQDPFGSLNPRMTVGQAVAEPLLVHRLETARALPGRVAELLRWVGLEARAMSRYPHEFSGGERQRVGIARALAACPEYVVCDEPVSALDVSIQAQIVNLLAELQGRLGIGYLFIAHDLAVVRHLSDRMAVMYLGQIVELGRKEDLCSKPLHPYTQALLEAVPTTDRRREKCRPARLLRGEVPNPAEPPPGCRFHPRCPQAMEVCRRVAPALAEHSDDRWVACHLYRAAPATLGPLEEAP